MNAAKKIGLWGPVALYTGFIFWLSSSCRPIPGMRFFLQMDKVWHLIEYGPYGLLWIRAIRGNFPGFSRTRSLLIALAAVAVVAALDEYYQLFVPLKFSSFWDGLADTIGAAIGMWICFLKEPAGT